MRGKQRNGHTEPELGANLMVRIHCWIFISLDATYHTKLDADFLSWYLLLVNFPVLVLIKITDNKDKDLYLLCRC